MPSIFGGVRSVLPPVQLLASDEDVRSDLSPVVPSLSAIRQHPFNVTYQRPPVAASVASFPGVQLPLVDKQAGQPYLGRVTVAIGVRGPRVSFLARGCDTIATLLGMVQPSFREPLYALHGGRVLDTGEPLHAFVGMGIVYVLCVGTGAPTGVQPSSGYGLHGGAMGTR